jgi:23S rRNA (cytosine1962-C5)-methyltransferase
VVFPSAARTATWSPTVAWTEGQEISFRVLGGPKDSDLGELLVKRFTAAHDIRTKLLGLHEVTNGARIIHGEADGCPGLIVDRYNRTLVVLAYALGWVANAELVEAALRALPGRRPHRVCAWRPAFGESFEGIPTSRNRLQGSSRS